MEINQPQRRQLEEFASAIQRSPHNLVSRRARDELWSRHIPECVSLARAIPPVDRVLDLGSGGGFPGVVIAIVRPEIAVTMVDSVGKKVAFLQSMSDSLELGAAVLHGRAEDRAVQAALIEPFAIVTARAMAPLQRLLPWAWPYVAPAGRLWAVKGARWQAEIDEAADVLSQLDAEVPEIIHTAPLEPGGVSSLVVSIARSHSG